MCDCCSDTKKIERSELGISACKGSLRLILDTPFNRKWYPNLIGRKFTSKNCPGYVQWAFADISDGEIFDERDISIMDTSAYLIGKAADSMKLFA